MAITRSTPTLADDSGKTSLSFAHTPAAANMKDLVRILVQGQTPTTPAFGGDGLIEVGSVEDITGLRLFTYYVDSTLSAAAQNLTFGLASAANVAVYIESILGGATGVPEAHAKYSSAGGAGPLGDSDITVTAGAFVSSFSASNDSSSTSVSADVTLENSDLAGNPAYANAIKENAAAGGIQAGWSWPDWARKISDIVSIAEASAAGSFPHAPHNRRIQHLIGR